VRILSQLTNTVQTLLGLFIACTGVHYGFKNQHWPMKRTLFLTQECCQWRSVHV